VQTNYTVTATLGQCTKTASVSIGVNPAPLVNAGPDQAIITGDEATLNGTTNGASFVWSPPAGLNFTNVLSPVAKPAGTTTYTLTATGSTGCTAKDDVLITVLPDCVKPRNAFSPNGDGINDKWVVVDNGNCLNQIDVAVFDRSGSKVFEDRNYRNTWDGTYRGKPLPDGTYYFTIIYTYITTRAVTVRGNVTILR
jgi:gliding motility-associated-like protein